jgi:hypothetical protein
MKKIYWINREGEKIDIDTMDIQYLRNSLKMALKMILKFEEDYKEITRKKEIKSTGNIEQAFYEAMVDAEMREMGYSDEDDYEYYLKTRG